MLQANEIANASLRHPVRVLPYELQAQAHTQAHMQERIASIHEKAETKGHGTTGLLDKAFRFESGAMSQLAAFTNAAAQSSSFTSPLSGQIQFLLKLMELWQLPRDDARLLLGYGDDERQKVNDLLEGRIPLQGPDREERVASLFRIRSLLSSLFRDINAENEWLREPRPALGQRSPLELLRSGSFEHLLTLRHFLEHNSGL